MQEDKYKQHPTPHYKCMDVYTKCAIVYKEPIQFFTISNIQHQWQNQMHNAKGGNEIPVVTENLSSCERQKFQGSEIKLLTFWRIGMRTNDNGNNLTT
jgi:hypothetical protein